MTKPFSKKPPLVETIIGKITNKDLKRKGSVKKDFYRVLRVLTKINDFSLHFNDMMDVKFI